MAEPAADNVFKLIEDTETEQSKQTPRGMNAAVNLFLISLKTLSQRTLIALTDCFTLLTVGCAFYVWTAVPDPNVHQIASQSIFAVFVLAINWIVRRK